MAQAKTTQYQADVSDISTTIQLFCVVDTKLQTYYPPYGVPTAIHATRMFQVAVLDDKTALGQFPQDFELRQIGTMDSVTGKITQQDIHTFITNGLQILAQATKLNQAQSNP